MDRRPLGPVLARNWLVLIIGIALTAAGSVLAFSKTTPTFKAKGTGFLIAQTAQTDANGNQTNPLKDYGTTSANLGRIVVAIADGNDVAGTAAQKGGTASYTVTVDSKAPIITIAATGSSNRQVTTTVTAVLGALTSTVAQIQLDKHVVASKQIAFQLLSVPTKASEQRSKRLILPAVVVGVGMLASFALALAVDSLRGGPRRRRHETSYDDISASSALHHPDIRPEMVAPPAAQHAPPVPAGAAARVAEPAWTSELAAGATGWPLPPAGSEPAPYAAPVGSEAQRDAETNTRLSALRASSTSNGASVWSSGRSAEPLTP